jgi:TolB-like protein/tetratricopeptide (TPR) repeat protein
MSNLFEELKRRNVFRVAIAYIAVAWLVLQVSDIVFENFGTPDWVMKTLMFVLAIGFPLAVLFAWAFEMTPEGITKEKDVDRSESITAQTGQKLNRTIIVVLLAAVGFLLADKFVLREPAPETPPIAEATTEKSVAVLPFVAMSRGPDDEFFADGLTEEILNSLTRVPELLVTARTSAFHFKGKDIPIPEIAAQLGVAHVVEGSVRRDRDRLRVTAQLIRAADGFHLWSENYDRETEDTFGVQTDIAEKIASALDVFLDDETLTRMKSSGFRNPEAYVAYQKGLQVYNDAHNHWDISPLLEEANTWFDRVIELEPGASRAYLHRVDLYTHLLADSYSTMPPKERERVEERFRADLDAAVRTATDDASRAAARFDRAMLTGNWREIRPLLEDYAAIPGCPTAAWLNTNTVEFGMAPVVLDLGERLVACDPQNPFGWWYTMQAHMWLGAADRAVEIGEQAVATVDHSTLRQSLFHAYIAAGRLDDAEYALSQEDGAADELADRRMTLAAVRGDSEAVLAYKASMLRHHAERIDVVINYLPRSGDREGSNRIAAELDALPYGYLSLLGTTAFCMCGAPWDIEATPNFRKRIEDAGFAWPPASPIEWPLKDW